MPRIARPTPAIAATPAPDAAANDATGCQRADVVARPTRPKNVRPATRLRNVRNPISHETPPCDAPRRGPRGVAVVEMNVVPAADVVVTAEAQQGHDELEREQDAPTTAQMRKICVIVCPVRPANLRTPDAGRPFYGMHHFYQDDGKLPQRYSAKISSGRGERGAIIASGGGRGGGRTSERRDHAHSLRWPVGGDGGVSSSGRVDRPRTADAASTTPASRAKCARGASDAGRFRVAARAGGSPGHHRGTAGRQGRHRTRGRSR